VAPECHRFRRALGNCAWTGQSGDVQ
jgi:hypothetical protein